MRSALSFIIVQNIVVGACFNEFINSYETLDYQPVAHRGKRSLGAQSPINIRFNAHNRSFSLILRYIDKDSLSVFHDNFILDVDGKQVNIAQNEFIVNGYDRNNHASSVYGSIQDGILEGHIHHGDNETYTVARVANISAKGNKPNHFHSIIYSDSDINFWSRRPKRSAKYFHSCGLYDHVRERMEKFQRSAVMDDVFTKSNQTVWKSFAEHDIKHDAFPYRYYTNEKLERHKRNGPRTDIVKGKYIHRVRACYVYLQADHKLYQHIFEKEGNHDEVRTREEIVSLFHNHVKAVNQIYEETDFDGVRGITFVIQRISLYTPLTCINGRSNGTAENPFCEENVDVSNFLNLNSRKNHSDFCLAYAFTFRDFVGGTLGLAWVASPNHNTAGGICQQYTRYSEGTNFVYRSLNTGIITLVNYGNRVPNRVSQLTLAHEIGHNFGSPHDYPLECQPGLPNGNYIMFASATSGDKKNNAQFSTCSVASISVVLGEVLQQRPIDIDVENNYRLGGFGLGNGKRNCFREAQSAFCGNQVKEPGEECDCGYTTADCKTMNDNCCHPREAGLGCKRRNSAACSPSEGPCCDAQNCTFHLTHANKICRSVSDCLEEQRCNGRSAECPPSTPKRDGLPCRDSTKVCNAGSCNGSICTEVGLKDCFLTKGSAEDLCHLACADANGTCRSTLYLPQFGSGRFKQAGRENIHGLILLPGSPCNNYKGYCDIFRKCRSVDADGPLARLKTVIFNPKTLNEVRYWIQVNWWIVVLCGLGLFVFMASFIKCCAVHTPSTNPNKAPALNIYDTLRRPKTLIHRPRQSHQQRQVRANSGLMNTNRNRNSANQDRGSSQITFHTLPSVPPPPIPHSSVSAQSNVIVIEPPPPYAPSIDPGSALGGPKRGRRKQKLPTCADSRVRKNRCP